MAVEGGCHPRESIADSAASVRKTPLCYMRSACRLPPWEQWDSKGQHGVRLLLKWPCWRPNSTASFAQESTGPPFSMGSAEFTSRTQG